MKRKILTQLTISITITIIFYLLAHYYPGLPWSDRVWLKIVGAAIGIGMYFTDWKRVVRG